LGSTGKSALVQRFAGEVGLARLSLLGSQLAPEDLIGVPQIVDGCSRFCPPVSIARSASYCLFLDGLSACSHEVQVPLPMTPDICGPTRSEAG
jgi:hypothetical protein